MKHHELNTALQNLHQPAPSADLDKTILAQIQKHTELHQNARLFQLAAQNRQADLNALPEAIKSSVLVYRTIANSIAANPELSSKDIARQQATLMTSMSEAISAGGKPTVEFIDTAKTSNLASELSNNQIQDVSPTA